MHLRAAPVLPLTDSQHGGGDVWLSVRQFHSCERRFAIGRGSVDGSHSAQPPPSHHVAFARTGAGGVREVEVRHGALKESRIDLRVQLLKPVESSYSHRHNHRRFCT